MKNNFAIPDLFRTFAPTEIYYLLTLLIINIMANRNPYVSTLLKRLAEHNNVQINERVAQLGDFPSKDDIVAVFKDFNLELPTTGRKLNDEEKAERKQQREQKKAEKAEKEKQIIEDKFAALKDVLINGTDEEKRALNEIIEKHKKTLVIQETQRELENVRQQAQELERKLARLQQ